MYFMPMPKKTQIALNRGRLKAGLKPIRFGVKKKKKKSSGSRKGPLSEEGYAKRLQKELGKEALVFRAGDMSKSGVPDIVAFYRGRPSFYEVKSIGDLLKGSQEKWIKKNCLEKRRKACIVFYRVTKGGHFRYRSIRLFKKSLKNYCLSAPKSQREKTTRRLLRLKYSKFT